MTLEPLHRTVAGLAVAIFLAIGAADASGLHVCPHHGQASSPSEHDHGHRGHDSDDAPGHACTCVGLCHLAPPVPAIGGAGGAPPASPTHPSSATVTPRGEAAADPPYLLPFGNGPPSDLA